MMKRYFSVFILLILFTFNCSAYSYEDIKGKWILSEEIILEDVIQGSDGFHLSGLIIEYDNNFITFDGVKYEIKRIQEEIVNSETLEKETSGSMSKGVTFEDLDIRKSSVIEVVIKTNKGYTVPGSIILFLDKDNLILEKDGVYYRMKRIIN